MTLFLADFASAFQSVYDFVWNTPEQAPWLAVLLLLTGIYVTFRMGFIQFRAVGHAFNVIRGKYDDPEHQGDISHFQALTTALSATVGIGNIAGVATAIHFGGPGAIFWMWMTGLFGMCLKYVEVTLAMRYREFDEDGNSSGGPQRYILNGLGSRWKPLAVFFAICAILSSFGSGNMNQINTLADALHTQTGVPFWVVGVASAFLVGLVILGGIKRIGRVTSILMPFMAVIYVFAALAVLALNYDKIGWAFQSIVTEAFNPTAGICGTAAGTMAMTFLWGVKRGLFSNEAGQGSAPIAHAAAKTDEPVREGLVALLGPLIDTLIICTMTALVVIIAGHWDDSIEEIKDLGHKDVKVYTWVEGEELTLAGFGDAAGYREAVGRIEEAGYSGAVDDGEVDEGAATEEILVIRDGRPHRIRHHDGTETGAILIMNEAPILFDGAGHGILKDRVPWSGEITVSGGQLTDAAKGTVEGVSITGSMIKTGQALTAHSFHSTLGGFGTIMVTIAVVLFGLSTAISWSYYGDRCTEFLFGIRAVFIYRCVFLFFVYLGAVLPLQMVWDLGDLALGLMTIPNLIAIFALSGVVRSMQNEYYSREHKQTR